MLLSDGEDVSTVFGFGVRLLPSTLKVDKTLPFTLPEDMKRMYISVSC